MDFGIAAQENTYYILQALMGRDKVVSLGFPSSQRDQQQTIAPDDMAQARKLASSCEKLILFPSRKNWGDSSKGYDKGTKRFICAYEKWRNSNEASDHKVICPIHGNKSKEFRRQLEARVPLEQWVVSNGNLSRSFLYALMCQENAILMDHFHDVGRSVISGVAREALAFGTPLVSSLDIHGDLFSAAYGPDCPIYKASSEGEIVAALEKITGMSRFELRSWRERITNWHYKNLSPESFVDRLQPYLL
jgi:hypothetical protein